MTTPDSFPAAAQRPRLKRPHDVALAVVLIALLTSPCMANASPFALERFGAEGSDSLGVLSSTDSLVSAPEDSLAVEEVTDSLEVDAPVFRRRASLPT